MFHGQDMASSGVPGRSQCDFHSAQAGGTEDMRFSRADLGNMNEKLIAASACRGFGQLMRVMLSAADAAGPDKPRERRRSPSEDPRPLPAAMTAESA